MVQKCKPFLNPINEPFSNKKRGNTLRDTKEGLAKEALTINQMTD